VPSGTIELGGKSPGREQEGEKPCTEATAKRAIDLLNWGRDRLAGHSDHAVDVFNLGLFKQPFHIAS
jgi:hypothetical protein